MAIAQQPAESVGAESHAAERGSDEQLWIAFRLGDQEALRELERRYTIPLHRYIWSKLDDFHLAEDVCQEVWLRVYEKADSFDMGRRFQPWFYTIAHHIVVDTFRKLGRQPTVSLNNEVVGVKESDEPSTFADLLEDEASPQPIDALITEETRGEVQHALESVKPHNRIALYLRYYNGLSYQEIADLLGVPMGTVKSRIHTGRTELGATLVRYRPEEYTPQTRTRRHSERHRPPNPEGFISPALSA